MTGKRLLSFWGMRTSISNLTRLKHFVSSFIFLLSSLGCARQSSKVWEMRGHGQFDLPQWGGCILEPQVALSGNYYISAKSSIWLVHPGQADLYILRPVLCRCESIQTVSHLHQQGEGDVQGDFHINRQICKCNLKLFDPKQEYRIYLSFVIFSPRGNEEKRRHHTW